MWVNGTLVWDEPKSTGARPGQVAGPSRRAGVGDDGVDVGESQGRAEGVDFVKILLSLLAIFLNSTFKP